MKYYAKIWEDNEEGHFLVEFPDIPFCVTYGHTFEEALVYAEDALTGVILTMQDIGDPIPEAKVYEGEQYHLIAVNYDIQWDLNQPQEID